MAKSAVAIIEESNLSRRRKTYALEAAKAPETNYSDIARRHGVTPATVHELLNDPKAKELVTKARVARLDKARDAVAKFDRIADRLLSSLEGDELDSYDAAQRIVLMDKVLDSRRKLLEERDRYPDRHKLDDGDKVLRDRFYYDTLLGHVVESALLRPAVLARMTKRLCPHLLHLVADPGPPIDAKPSE